MTATNMKITKITCYKDRKLQIAEFEPYSFGFGAEAEVEPGEDIMKAYKDLEYWVDAKIDLETMKWKNPQKLVNNILKGKVDKDAAPF